MKRLSLIELHLAGLKRSMMGKIKGGADYKCRCSFNNPLISTRESGGSGTLCFCVETDGKVSAGVQSQPVTTGHHGH
jgi:hypothetical protein